MRRPLVTVAAATLLASMVLLLPGSGAVRPAHGLSYSKLNKIQRRILSGFATSELNPAATTAAVRPRSARQARPGDVYFPTDSLGCPDRKGSNVKANRNCLNLADADLTGRSQANNETSVAIDPATGDLVMGDNDYRRGDSGCVAGYSRDGGRTWSDSEVPTGFTRGDAFGAAREYWQGAGDPTVAFDTRGNAYFACLQFNRGQPITPVADVSSAIYLYRSTGNAGASWNFPGRAVVENPDVTGTSGVLEDKELLAVDNHRGSPFRDRIYVTWTEFAADGTAYIWSRTSADYGESFGPRVLVSGASPACTNTFGLPTPHGPCNENQFSQPFVGPDGDLYVAWSNFNSAAEPPGPEVDQPAAGDRAAQQPEQPGEDEGENAYQVLVARSTDGGASFGAPVKVSDYNDLPDCETYQDGAGAGSSCVPEKGSTANSFFRAANY
ncbi:MAG: sialidase family protein, partial [Actinomycetes bacterium]